MITKYDFEFTKEVIEADKKRLINQIWKLIPMREKEEEWEGHLSCLIEEITGMNLIFMSQLNYLILLAKLEGLRSEECNNFIVFRSTVFRCIKILAGLLDDAAE